MNSFHKLADELGIKSESRPIPFEGRVKWFRTWEPNATAWIHKIGAREIHDKLKRPVLEFPTQLMRDQGFIQLAKNQKISGTVVHNGNEWVIKNVRPDLPLLEVRLEKPWPRFEDIPEAHKQSDVKVIVKEFDPEAKNNPVYTVEGNKRLLINRLEMHRAGLSTLENGRILTVKTWDQNGSKNDAWVYEITNAGKRPDPELIPPFTIAGRVKFHNSEKGYGYVATKDPRVITDVYFREKDVEAMGLTHLADGQPVNCFVDQGSKGWYVKNMELRGPDITGDPVAQEFAQFNQHKEWCMLAQVKHSGIDRNGEYYAFLALDGSDPESRVGNILVSKEAMDRSGLKELKEGGFYYVNVLYPSFSFNGGKAFSLYEVAANKSIARPAGAKEGLVYPVRSLAALAASNVVK